MNQKLTNIFKNTRNFIGKYSPELLIGLGLTGMITSTVLAVKSTPKALYLIEDRKKELNVYKLTTVETIKVAWKPYIPSVLLSAASISCIIGATSINLRRNAALATAYTISERTLVRYRDKVIDALGDKREKKIREEVAQEETKDNKINNTQVFITSGGNTLCMDKISGRYFKSDMETIKRAVNDLNRELVFEMYVSLNDFYERLGLEPTKIGEHLGWNLDNGLIEIEFNTALAEDGEPCLVLDYDISPRYGYDKLM